MDAKKCTFPHPRTTDHYCDHYPKNKPIISPERMDYILTKSEMVFLALGVLLPKGRSTHAALGVHEVIASGPQVCNLRCQT